MNKETPSFSAVIPCYHSAKSLPELIERVQKVFLDMRCDYEIILVSDGSLDDTWEVISQLVTQYKGIVAVKLSRNFGQQAAVLCGFEYVTKDYVITLDDDLQHRPEDIPLLFNHLVEENLDVVIASLDGKKHGLIRSVGTKFVRYISKQVLGIPKGFKFSSFRIIKTAVAKNTLRFTVANPVVGFLIFKATRNIGNFHVEHDERRYGQSNYSFVSLLNYCMTMMLDYSVIPLKLVGYLGVVISLFSFCLGFFYLFTWAVGNIKVSGFVTGILLMCFFFGLLFISIGIIGAYFIRILENSNVHPSYVVETVNRSE